GRDDSAAADVVVGHPAGSGRPGPPPPAGARRPRPLRRRVPAVAPRRARVAPDGAAYSLPGTEPFRFPACAGYADACGSWLAFSGEDGSFL
ncbi:unnamed protein product, partial [Urochloa humidicola]